MKKLFSIFESSSQKMFCIFALFFVFFTNSVLFSEDETITNLVPTDNFETENNKKFEEWEGDVYFEEMPGETKYDDSGKLVSITFFKDLKNVYTDYYLYTKNGEVRGVKRVYSDGKKSELFSSLKNGGFFREYTPKENATDSSEFRFYDILSREISRNIVSDEKIIDYQKRDYSGDSQVPSVFVEEKDGEKTVVSYSSSGEIEKIVKYLSENSTDQTIYSYNGNGELISKLEVSYNSDDLQEKKETRYKYIKSEIKQVTIFINNEKQLERIYSVPGDEYADYTEKLYKNNQQVLEVLFSDGKKKTETVIDSGKIVRVRTFL